MKKILFLLTFITSIAAAQPYGTQVTSLGITKTEAYITSLLPGL